MTLIQYRLTEQSETVFDRLCIARIGMGSSILFRKGFLKQTIQFRLLASGMPILVLISLKLGANLAIF